MSTEKFEENWRGTYNVVKANNPWKREGYCKRCGKCCYIWNRQPDGTKRREPCDFLRYDGNTAVCLIYDTRPDICRDFPVLPYLSKQDKEWYTDCGYFFSTNIEEETHDAIKKLNTYCGECKKQNKDFCPRRIKFLEDIFKNKGFDHICDGSCEDCENKGKHQL
jgi:Fe-S-cluster containining protein